MTLFEKTFHNICLTISVYKKMFNSIIENMLKQSLDTDRIKYTLSYRHWEAFQEVHTVSIPLCLFPLLRLQIPYQHTCTVDKCRNTMNMYCSRSTTIFIPICIPACHYAFVYKLSSNHIYSIASLKHMYTIQPLITVGDFYL